MAKPTHYSPVIRRELVRALYYERVRRGIPMTRLVDELLSAALQRVIPSATGEANSPRASE